MTTRTGGPRCASCGEGTLQFLFHARDRNRGATERQFAVARCRRCGVVQTFPQPSPQEMGSYYPEAYYPLKEDSAFTRAFQMEKIAFVRRHKTSGKLLDIGTGVGYFLQEAREAGFEAEGIELSAQAAEAGREHLGVTIRTGALDDMEIPPATFDIVTLWHVFEHLHRPKEVLRLLGSILRQDGLLVIAVPNMDSLQAKLFRSHWYHLDVPRHLFHYGPQTLRALVEGKDFHVKEIYHHSREHNAGGVLGSVMRLSPPGESLVHKAVRKLALMPLASAAAWGENALERGGTFILAATRR